MQAAVESAHSGAEALRNLGLRPAGGNHQSLKRWTAFYGIDTDHFDLNWAARHPTRRFQPLEELMVRGSNYSRGSLKRRLFAEGLKARACELCGQGEEWRGVRMSLILDHVNGDATDNRLDNLRILCPNCNATLDTHCGRGGRIERLPRDCVRCGIAFTPRSDEQRYCSRQCGVHARGTNDPKPHIRKVERPPYEQLKAELAASNYSAVGRRYGVSDNAVRKWMRWYEASAAREAAAARETAAREAAADRKTAARDPAAPKAPQAGGEDARRAA